MAQEGSLGRDYLWNTLGSVMNAAASVVLLLVTTRVLGSYWGGVFSIAYAVGQQFQTLGAFEMRPMQSTDVEKEHAFSTYLASRILTTFCMVGCIVGYALLSTDIAEEFLLIVLIAGLKIFDVLEDVFHGAFQQNGRLDVAGKAFFFRSLVTTVVFIAALVLSKSLSATCIITIIISAIALVGLNLPPAKQLLAPPGRFDVRDMFRLLGSCLPLFAGAFLAMYLSNAPKFGLDAYMVKDFQAYYSALFMPALVINLLSAFVFRPLLTRLAVDWIKRETSVFLGTIVKGLLWVGVASAGVAVLAFFLGVPVLSFLFGLDLSPYRAELMVLVLGGAFNAASIVVYYGLVVMRMQVFVLAGYGCAAAFAYVLGGNLVQAFGIMDASLLYASCMLVVVIAFALFFAVGFRHKTRKAET